MAEPPNLKTESTVEQIVMWLRTSRCNAWVEGVFKKPVRDFAYVDEALDVDYWPAGQWKPTRAQYVVLVVLLQRAMEGKPELEIDATFNVLVDMMKLPEIVWPHVMVNIEEGTFQLHDIERVEVDEVRRIMNVVPKKKGQGDGGEGDPAGR